MTDMVIGTLLFVLGFMSCFLMFVRSLSATLKRIANKYENGNVEKLLK